jgi:hypothetical protein
MWLGPTLDHGKVSASAGDQVFWRTTGCSEFGTNLLRLGLCSDKKTGSSTIRFVPTTEQEAAAEIADILPHRGHPGCGLNPVVCNSEEYAEIE